MTDLNQLLASLVEKKGVALHLVPGSPPLFRSSREGFAPLGDTPLAAEDSNALLLGALNDEQKSLLSQNKEISIAYSIQGVGRFRTSIFYQRGSLGAVFRLLPQGVPELDQLNLPPVLKEIDKKSQGLILIAGPKGSGKSHTLAAVLDFLLSSRGVQIISLENPIEFLLKNKKGVIYQREIGTDARSFKEAVQTALRQNPDVLALSELSDLESVMSVLTASSSGQLVIATISANGILMALEQLIELAPPHHQAYLRGQLGAGFELGISQLLLRGQDGSAVLAAEILIGTPAIKGTIREGKMQQLLNTMNNNRDAGMISQEFALKNLTKKNLISAEDALAKAVRPEELKRLLTMQM